MTDAAETTSSSSDTTEGLTVLVADEDAEALHSTARVLGELGHHVAAYAVSVGQAAERISEEDPDLSVVAVHDDLEHALDLIDELSESARGPVVAVVETTYEGTSSPVPPRAGSTASPGRRTRTRSRSRSSSRCAGTRRRRS